MNYACRIIALGSPLLLVLFGTVSHGLLVETCQELQAAFESTKTQDVVIEIDPWGSIDCASFTTMSMDSNTLTVQPSYEAMFGSPHVDLNEVRLEITNGAKLIWEPVVEFRGTDDQDVNGGGCSSERARPPAS